MISEPRAKPITAGDFEKFDPEWRYDLIRGEFFPRSPAPDLERGEIISDLAFWLARHVKLNRSGLCFASGTRFVVEMHPDTALAPHWAFIAKSRAPKKLSDKFSRIVPDAVLEARSPSDRESAVVKQMNRWIAAGVRIAWELNPKKRILTVYRPNREPRKIDINGTISGEDVLPGFELPMRSLFEPS